MPAQRWRYIGETPVTIPELLWGDEDSPVMPGDISHPYEGEVNNELIVVVGSREETVWLDNRRKAPTGSED